MQTRQAGGRGEEDAGNIQAWIGVPASLACPGTAGQQGAPGAEGWPELCYCWAAGTSVLPQLLGMELLPHSRGSPEGSQHFGRKFCMDPLPPARVGDPTPGKAGEPGGPKPQPQSSPNSPGIPCLPKPCASPKLHVAPGSWHGACAIHSSPSPLAALCVFSVYIPGSLDTADHTRGTSRHWLTSSS